MAIDDFVNGIEKEAEKLERDLYDEIMAIVIGLMLIDGKTVLNEKNLARVGMIDKAFKSFDTKFQKPYFKSIMTHLKGLEKANMAYLESIGVDAKTFDGFGALVKRMDDYLSELGLLTPVKQQVKSYLTSAISQGRGLGTIRMGIRDILGLKNRIGALNRYFRTYLYTTIMQFDRIVSNEIAKESGLNYFVYKGGLIETSRDFCIARDGLVFRRDQADDWKNDPTLPAYPDTADYVPLIDLGRWNCRHYLLWITDERAKELNK